MEKIQTIEQYIAAEMGGKIVKKRNSPVFPLLILIIGIGLLMVMIKVPLGDAMMTTTLTLCIICSALGIILTAMNLSGAMCHYQYVATGSRMKDKKVYLAADDYNKVINAFADGSRADFGELHPVVSSNSALRILHSKDSSIALVQPMRDECGHLEPSASTLCLVGSEVTLIEPLCR